MWEVKLVGGVLVASGAVFLGLAFQEDLKKRKELLRELHRGFLFLRQEIEYRKLPLEEALIHSSRPLKDPLASVFRETGKKLEVLPGISFLEIWEEMSRRYLEETPLKQEDWELLFQLGSQLQQIYTGNCSGILAALEKRIEMAFSEAEEEYKEKAQLYRRLGMMGGIFLVILLL